LGVATAAAVYNALASVREQLPHVDAVIHDLLGHAPEAVATIIKVAGVSNPLLWLHDYSTLCDGYTLMRNDVEFCSSPPPSSTACMICCHGAGRVSHLQRVQWFFESQRPTVVSPSEVALQVWQAGDLRPAESEVQPLAYLVEGDEQTRVAGSSRDRRVTVAFISTVNYSKGWDAFEGLAWRFAEDPRYSFIRLGNQSHHEVGNGVRTVEVQVSAEDPLAMVAAIQREFVDVVVIWSRWAETFSFVTLESMATGALIVARGGTTNVVALIERYGYKAAIVVNTDEELFELFRSGAVWSAANDRTVNRSTIIHTGGAINQLIRRHLSRQSANRPPGGRWEQNG
jgi:hypothetical protein